MAIAVAVGVALEVLTPDIGWVASHSPHARPTRPGPGGTGIRSGPGSAGLLRLPQMIRANLARLRAATALGRARSDASALAVVQIDRLTLAQAGRAVRVSYGPGSVSFLVPPVPARGWVFVYCAPTAGRLRRGWARRPVTGREMLGVQELATAGCPYWALSVATVRGCVDGRPLLHALRATPFPRLLGRVWSRCVHGSGPRCQILVRSPRSVRGPASSVVLGMVAARLALMCPAPCPGIGRAGDVAPWPCSRLMDPGPESRASSRRVGACSAMWNHRPTNRHIRPLSSVLPAFLCS